MELLYLPNLMVRSLDTITHSLLCTLHCALQPIDVVYLCGVGNACFAPFLRLCGKKVIINVDGIDFKRRKWSGFARWWLYRSEKWSIRFTDRVIADNEEVVRHYQKLHAFTPLHLSYGVSPPPRSKSTETLERWGLKPGQYLLYVGRLSPENEPDLLLQAYSLSSRNLPLVMVGMAGYEKSFFRHLQQLATPNVIFTGPVYGPGYAELSQNCRAFILPAAIEATRLVLLDQMGFGNAIIFRESPATREVIAECGLPFSGPDPAASLAERLNEAFETNSALGKFGEKSRQRAETVYGWGTVLQQYETILADLVPTPRPAKAAQAAISSPHTVKS
jgi:glycosyltransferase involved in cell wall biosynthesis